MPTSYYYVELVFAFKTFGGMAGARAGVESRICKGGAPDLAEQGGSQHETASLRMLERATCVL